MRRRRSTQRATREAMVRVFIKRSEQSRVSQRGPSAQQTPAASLGPLMESFGVTHAFANRLPAPEEPAPHLLGFICGKQ